MPKNRLVIQSLSKRISSGDAQKSETAIYQLTRGVNEFRYTSSGHPSIIIVCQNPNTQIKIDGSGDLKAAVIGLNDTSKITNTKSGPTKITQHDSIDEAAKSLKIDLSGVTRSSDRRADDGGITLPDAAAGAVLLGGGGGGDWGGGGGPDFD